MAKKHINKLIGILAILAIISIFVYYFSRLYFFHVFDNSIFNYSFALILLIGETYMIIHAIGFMLNAIRISNKRFSYKTENILPVDQPSVAVIVVARHEPKEILFETFATMRALDYQNKNLYLLDGSSDQKFLKSDQEIAKKFGVKVFKPAKLHGAKAGCENDFIKGMQEEFLAVFDADQNPAPDFLQSTMALALRDEKIAFVQTPQFYSNIECSPITKAAAMQQSVFYESICEAKGSINAMFCCGTNVLFRKKALIDVNGFDEESITEDFATSLKLHLNGWKSIYYNHVRVFGMGPETLSGYFKQQFRWSAGTIGVFRKIIFEFFKNPFRLTANQWWEYFLSGTYYFIGWAFFLLMICPIVFLLFGVPTYFMNPWIYLATYTPYFIITLIVFYGTMKSRHYNLIQVYHGIIMGSVIHPILMVSSLAGLSGKKLQFTVTPKGVDEKMPFQYLWPWHFLILLNVIAITYGIINFSSNPYAIGVNIFWAVYHTFILSHVYYFNRSPKISKNKLLKEINGQEIYS